MKFYTRTCSLSLAVVQKLPEKSSEVADLVDEAWAKYGDMKHWEMFKKPSPKITKSMRFSEDVYLKMYELGDGKISPVVNGLLEHYFIMKWREENGTKTDNGRASEQEHAGSDDNNQTV